MARGKMAINVGAARVGRAAKLAWAALGGLRLVVVVALAGILLPACGARVGPYLGASAGLGQSASGPTGGSQLTTGKRVKVGSSKTPTAQLGPSSSYSSSGTSSSGSSSSGTSSLSASSTSSQSSQAVPHTSPSSFNFSPAAEAAYCPNANGNTASAPGVTPTSITFGNVSGLTGPLTGTFGAGYEAVTAAFDAVNADGGICGRKLLLDVEDDGQDASRNAADIEDLIQKPVFAFAGSLSDADNGGVQEMVQANIPDVGFAINNNRSEAPTYWSDGGGSALYVINGTAYSSNTVMVAQKHFGQFPTRMAILSYSIPVSATAGEMYAKLYQQAGATICYTDFSISEATASLQGDVIQMQDNHCNGVYTTLDVVGNAKLLQAMQEQNFHPPFAGSTFDAYTPDQITDAGEAAAQGFQMSLPFLPLSSSNPVVKMYVSELATYEPGKVPSGFGLEDYADAQMIIYALDQLGHNPTRAGMVNIFNSLTNFSVDGAVAPDTPNQRAPNFPAPNSPPLYGLAPSCYVEVEVKGNGFSRVWPSSGYFCGGAMVPVGPASTYGE